MINYLIKTIKILIYMCKMNQKNNHSLNSHKTILIRKILFFK